MSFATISLASQPYYRTTIMSQLEYDLLRNNNDLPSEAEGNKLLIPYILQKFVDFLSQEEGTYS
jgi:hypothetical protein